MAEISQLIPEHISECAIYLKKAVDEPCMSNEMVTAVAATHGVSGSPSEILKSAQSATGCDSERCVLNKLNTDASRREIMITLKIEGPTDAKLLSNINIDAILEQWTRKFHDFHPYNFNMLNYASYSFRQGEVVNRPDTLATMLFSDLYESGKRIAACVINSDKYQGGGKHWMALFVDARSANATVEFFNSSGRAPAPEWISWIVKTQSGLEQLGLNAKIVKSTSIKHQNSRSECGLYSLFYIYARLNNIPYEFFLTHPVDDKHMFEFRQHLFHSGDEKEWNEGKKFNWNLFQKKVKLEWEK